MNGTASGGRGVPQPAATGPSKQRRRVARVFRVLRDAWLVIGVAVLLWAALEVAYRLQAVVRMSRVPEATAADAFPDSAAWRALVEEERRTYRTRWEPLVYYRREPFAGTWFNVDSAGLRHTVQPADALGAANTVAFFGGSTMWGTFQPDSATIPSQIAARLAASDVAPARVINYGEFGYESTRELVVLQRILQEGVRPAVVVFYDGINDVFTAVQHGRAGIPLNDQQRARDYLFGRTVFDTRLEVSADVRSLAALTEAMANRSWLFRRVRAALTRHAAGQEGPDTASLARDIVTNYRAVFDAACALATANGFHVLFYWQPTIHTTGKPLTSYERALVERLEGDPVQARATALHGAVAAELARSGPVSRPCGSLHTLAQLFDDEESLVFVDFIGHTHSGPVARVADTLAADILAALRAHPADRPRAP